MTQRIGILGGTFDPIHYGHLAIAEEARVALDLARILLIPAAHQPLKGGDHAASPRDRLAMVTLACHGNSAFEPCAIEIERAGPSYTVTTLEDLAARGPAEFHFIMGADALVELPRWRNVERVIALTRIVAVARPGYIPDLARVLAALPSLNDRLDLIEGPRVDISSTDLRRRIASGHPIRYLVPDAVIAYIRERQLYHGGASHEPAA